MPAPCLHSHGDFVAGLWLCGQCYAKLPERPTTYGPASSEKGWQPQVIISQAAIRKAENGVTLSVFIGQIAARLRLKSWWTLGKHDAVMQAISFMEASSVELGDPSYDWSRSAAKEWADTSIRDYWEHDQVGN